MQTSQIEDPFLKEMLISVSKQSAAHGHSLEYLEGALDWLLTQTRQKLTEKESVQFLAKLSMYPKWKLQRLDEFSGSLGQSFQFLDALNDAPRDNYKELGYDKDRKQLEHRPDKQIGKDTLAHIKRMMEYVSVKMSPAQLQEKRRIEREGLEELHMKYPHAGFDNVLRSDRLKN